jgi:hypothetical protein
MHGTNKSSAPFCTIGNFLWPLPFPPNKFSCHKSQKGETQTIIFFISKHSFLAKMSIGPGIYSNLGDKAKGYQFLIFFCFPF